MINFLKSVYIFFNRILPTLYNSIMTGINYDSTHKIVGKPIIIKPSLLHRFISKTRGGELIIGHNFLVIIRLEAIVLV